MEDREECFSCHGRFEAIDGPTHAYMRSTPGCWAAYGRLLAREYECPALFGQAHGMTVDAYALQHPGDPDDPRCARSVWVHGVSLCLGLEHGVPHHAATRIMQRLAKRAFPVLPDRPARFAVTHADVLAAPGDDHLRLVRDWAQATWTAWAPLHDRLRAFARQSLGAS